MRPAIFHLVRLIQLAFLCLALVAGCAPARAEAMVDRVEVVHVQGPHNGDPQIARPQRIPLPPALGRRAALSNALPRVDRILPSAALFLLHCAWLR